MIGIARGNLLWNRIVQLGWDERTATPTPVR